MSRTFAGPLGAFACALSACAALSGGARAQDGTSGLMAGAARVDITPEVADLPAPLTSVHDPLYIRTLVIDSAGQRAVVVVVDTPAIVADIYYDLIDRISAEFGVPAGQILLGTTHTHNSLRVAPPGESPIPQSEKFTQAVIDGTLQSIRDAVAAMQPAKAGYSAGESSLISGRNEWLPAQHRYIDGVDRTGTEAVDRTFGVYEFAALDGTPIAAILNYGVEPVIFEQANTQVSGDVPGAVSAYVEDQVGGGMVALFTVGAPASLTYRVWPEDSDKRRLETSARMMDAYGILMGEEALAQMARIEGSTAPLAIASAGDQLTCPGKKTTPRNLRNMCAYTADSTLPACEFKDAPFNDVTLTMNLLRLGDVYYLAADGNVVPALWEKVKSQSPFTHTQFVGANFGPFRFVVDDRGYQLNTYPATDTRAQANCAETGVLESFAKMSELLH
jgi:Neutral/alkaline non-lysosomal ceramidase, N-terminal